MPNIPLCPTGISRHVIHYVSCPTFQFLRPCVRPQLFIYWHLDCGCGDLLVLVVRRGRGRDRVIHPPASNVSVVLAAENEVVLQ
jgi:hypothetical protein